MSLGRSSWIQFQPLDLQETRGHGPPQPCFCLSPLASESIVPPGPTWLLPPMVAALGEPSPQGLNTVPAKPVFMSRKQGRLHSLKSLGGAAAAFQFPPQWKWEKEAHWQRCPSWGAKASGWGSPSTICHGTGRPEDGPRAD